MSKDDVKSFETKPDPNHIPPDIQAAMAKKMQQASVRPPQSMGPPPSSNVHK